MGKHTSGPWKRGQYGKVLTANGEVLLLTGIALATGMRSSIENEEIEANTDLVASAPELLEALKAIKQLLSPDGEYSIRRTDGQLMGLGDVMPIGAIFEKADAAIKKAEGEL